MQAAAETSEEMLTCLGELPTAFGLLLLLFVGALNY